MLEHDLAPEWLRQAWKISEQEGMDRLSMDEIDAEIAAARKTRREPQLQPLTRLSELLPHNLQPATFSAQA